MDRQERIFEYIKSEEYIPLTRDELAAVLDVPKEDIAKLDAILEQLCIDGKIMLTKKKRYISIEGDKSVAVGVLKCSLRKSAGFILQPDTDIYVSSKNMRLANGVAAFSGDTVLAEIISRGGTHPEGRIISVLKRGSTSLCGVVSKIKSSKGYAAMRPDNRAIYAHVKVSLDDLAGAEAGDRVAVEITGYTKDGDIRGIVKKVLGNSKDLKSRIEAIIFDHGIETEFPEEALLEAEGAPQTVSSADMAGRLDLRDKLIFTIDGDDSRDFDDAVSLDITSDGLYRLGVHIADVSHYVTEGSALDKSAMSRATSVYLPDRVIPMLPFELSNGICSLNPDEDRLTLSVFMNIDKNGSVVSHELYESVIRSKERMTYHNVTELLSGCGGELEERYGYMLDNLKDMERLAAILQKKRESRGSINFDFPEIQIKTNENSEPIEICPYERGVSNHIIEEFMLAANETIAEYAYWSELPFIYRVHEAPSADKMNAFAEFARSLGIIIKGRLGDGGSVHPMELQKILNRVKDTPEEMMISSTMLRSMMKADYRPDNNGHFGLAAKFYCHFTSPIRRYPDLAIHRILKENLKGGIGDKRCAALRSFTVEASAVSSAKETEAEYAERDTDDYLKGYYMSRFIGEGFDAVVSSITGFGMFVMLDNSVEGLIRLESMRDDFYKFDEASKRLIGARRGKIYKIGDKVRAVLVSVDSDSGNIDFRL